MADVDTSSYGAPTPVNPLQTIGSAAAIQNALNQNRLFQQQYNTNLAVSNIYKNAVDPNTGQIDPVKLRSLLASDPNASYGLPAAFQGSQEAQQRNLNISSAQIDLAQKHINALNGYLSPLLANKNVTSNDVTGAIAHAVTAGLVTPQEAANFYSSMPTVGGVPISQGGKIDETQVRSWLQRNQMQLMDAQGRLNAVSPKPDAYNLGGQTVFIRTPQIGSPSVAGTIANTLPPTTPTVGTVNGVPNTPMALGPTTSQLQVPPQPAGTPAPMPASAPQAAPQAQAQPGAAPTSAPATSVPAAAPSPSVAAGRVQTGLAPGVAGAAEVAAHGSAQQGLALQQAADQVPQQKALLGNLESTLNAFTPGPGSKWTNESSAFVNRALQALGGKGVATDAVSAQEEFNKLSTQLAQSQFAALGGTGTDAKLDSAMHVSPNAALSALGNRRIIALLKGNTDAIAAKNQAWQTWLQNGHGPESYGQFSTQFNKLYDPRVFQSQYMTKQDRQKMFSGMDKSEQKTFRQNYNFAVQHGWIPDPRQANGSQ